MMVTKHLFFVYNLVLIEKGDLFLVYNLVLIEKGAKRVHVA